MADQRYTIVQKIDSGGMAEVWKGKSSSIKGFEKLVAIKRVLPSLSKNKKFISMFLDEARLSLYLNHANVVQTFEIGMSENAYFIVMEWVDGTNLKGLLGIASELGFRLPREQACFIAIEICKGLSHAHNCKDSKGRPLSIVHRDISPPNILLSREGEVKLVDFGLAKAASQITSTDPGIVKGKFSYLSPEAAHGQVVDRRADVFAVGLVLWEMLAGRKLFDGETDQKTVELVRRAEIPSLRQFNPEVEPALEEVVNRALARDPRHRFQTAEQMGHELARHLFQHRMMVTSYDIATLVKRVLAYQEAHTETTRALSLETMVQEEIEHLTSIEDLEKKEFVSVLQHPGGDDSGLVGIGVDPRGWADELDPGSNEESIDDTMIADPSEFFEEDGSTMMESRSPAAPSRTAQAAPKERATAPGTAPPTQIQAPEPVAKGPDAARNAPAPVAAEAVQSPTGPQPATGKSISVTLGVLVGLIGAGALGVAIWLLAS